MRRYFIKLWYNNIAIWNTNLKDIFPCVAAAPLTFVQETSTSTSTTTSTAECRLRLRLWLSTGCQGRGMEHRQDEGKQWAVDGELEPNAERQPWWVRWAPKLHSTNRNCVLWKNIGTRNHSFLLLVSLAGARIADSLGFPWLPLDSGLLPELGCWHDWAGFHLPTCRKMF